MNIGAVDIGGTKTIVAVSDEKGHIVEQITFQTILKDCYQTFDLCCKYLNELTEKISININDLNGIGINVPGMFNPETQKLIKAPFTSWEDIPVTEYFKAKLNFQNIFVENDVKNCALGEKYFGYKDLYKNYIWITVSTGIGSAIVINGRILHGNDNMAGEIGHIKVEYEQPIKCTCGAYGCLEGYASGNAITQMVITKMKDDKKFVNEFESRNLSFDAKGCSCLAKIGVPSAVEIYNNMANYLSRGIATAINLINPQVVIIGGGVASSFDLLLPLVRKYIKNYILDTLSNVPIIQTKLGYEAALIGTIALVLESINNKVV